jgi:hypothetical protein
MQVKDNQRIDDNPVSTKAMPDLLKDLLTRALILIAIL